MNFSLFVFFGIILYVSSISLTDAKPSKKPKPSEDDDYYSDEEEEQLPKTSFSCDGKIDGFYADIEADCRVFHYCQSISYPDDTDERKDWAFFCPPTTIFRQEYLTCSKPHKSFKCSESENYFDVNEKLPGTTIPPGGKPSTPRPPSNLPSDDDEDTSEPPSHSPPDSDEDVPDSTENESNETTSTSSSPSQDQTTPQPQTTKRPRPTKPTPHHPSGLLPAVGNRPDTFGSIQEYPAFPLEFKPLWGYFFNNYGPKTYIQAPEVKIRGANVIRLNEFVPHKSIWNFVQDIIHNS